MSAAYSSTLKLRVSAQVKVEFFSGFGASFIAFRGGKRSELGISDRRRSNVETCTVRWLHWNIYD